MLGFFQVFLVIMPIAVPFFQSKGLSMQEVFTLQALFGVVVLITEVPSGYLADLFGAQVTLIIGAVFAGIGQYACCIAADGFWGLALFELALGYQPQPDLRFGHRAAVRHGTCARVAAKQAQRQIVGRLYSARTFSEAIAAVVCSVLMLVPRWTLWSTCRRPSAGCRCCFRCAWSNRQSSDCR